MNWYQRLGWPQGLFNLRGSDIPYNPVFLAYAYITASDIFLYVHEKQIDDKVKCLASKRCSMRRVIAIYPWVDLGPPAPRSIGYDPSLWGYLQRVAIKCGDAGSIAP